MKEKVLIIEDDPIWVDIIIEWLNQDFYTIFQAKSLKQAMEIINNNNLVFDIVVSDIILDNNNYSNIDGIIALKYLVEHSKVKIGIVITSHPSKKTKSMVRKLGASYIVKEKESKKTFEKIINSSKKNNYPTNQKRKTKRAIPLVAKNLGYLI